MQKFNLVMNFFRSLDSQVYTVESKADLVTQSIIDYINLVEPVKNHVEAKKDKRELIINFKPFNLEVFCHGSYKIYEIQENLESQCYQLHFFIKERDKNLTLLTVFITEDGYIVSNVMEANSICDIQDPNKGKRVFNLLLNSLYEGNFINI